MHDFIACHFYNDSVVELLHGPDIDNIIVEFFESVKFDFDSLYGHRLVLTGYFDTCCEFHDIHPETLVVTSSESIKKELFHCEKLLDSF